MSLYCTGLKPRPRREKREVVDRAGMNLWVLQKRPTRLVEPYERMQLREEAHALDIRFTSVASDEIDRVVTGDGQRSIRRCGAEVQLPDVLLPRTGSGIDDFSLAILRQLEHLGEDMVDPSRVNEAGKDKLHGLDRS